MEQLKSTVRKVIPEKEGDELLDKSKYYIYNANCNNCGVTNRRYILRGIRVDDIRKNIICNYCGCFIA